jgi:murein DD-endopeptidase MepM/ murein hydrolase activator NlpD
VASDWKRIEQAAAKYGHTLDSVAQRYVDPVTGKRLSGQALILKTIEGESGGRRDAVSSAGAKGWAQFMPGTRASFIHEFGVDAWRSPEDAVHALTLHMRGKGGHPTGLEGYNPGGGSSYVNYILGQKVGAPTARASGGLGGRLAASTSQGTQTAGPDASQTFSPGDLAALTADVQQPPGPPVSAPAPPTFAAGPVTPKLYQGLSVPGAAPAASQEDALGARLADIAAQGGDPSADLAGQQAGVNAGPATSSTPTTGGTGGGYSGRTPTGKRGKVIGTPYSGTHTLGNWQSDNAVDIAVPEGTPMVALQDGVIVKVRHHPQDGGRFAGDQITIRAANGNEYFYAHGKASVKPGEKIRKGEQLGVTGSANGVAHLHFGQMKGDPRQHT